MNTVKMDGDNAELLSGLHAAQELLKQVQQANRWIPVTEEVPDAGMTVLIYCPDASEPVWVGFLDQDEWLTAHSSFVEVTHWRPMPEPPEEGSLG